MTPDELNACLETVGWSRLGLAKRLGRPPNTIERWNAEQSPVPREVAAWLRALARFHERHPPPDLQPIPKEGPRDAKRLERLRGLIGQGMGWAEAARAMRETPKAVQSFGERHGITLAPKPATRAAGAAG